MEVLDENGTVTMADDYNVASQQMYIRNHTEAVTSSIEALVTSSTNDIMTSSTNDIMTSSAEGSVTSLSDIATTMIDEALNITTNSTNNTNTIHITQYTITPMWDTHEQVNHTTISLPVPVHVMPSHRTEPTFTGWSMGTQNINQIYGKYNIYMLYATFGIMVFCILGVVCWVQIRKKLMLMRYEPLLPTNHQDPDLIYDDPDLVYKASHGGLLDDDDYENTFVGVSVPILQDVTKV
jgi:hypothetical protein